jgi:3-methyladenine DNA glycosylase/8-oxoguanine DNA glycosylase
MTVAAKFETDVTRDYDVSPPFDLARTAAPVWWARGRWPNSDWLDGTLCWVGWEGERVVWRSVQQRSERCVVISGNAVSDGDWVWMARVLGSEQVMPVHADPVLARLAQVHAGVRQWSAGSLFEGFVSSIVGQSISVAAAAVTERRLYERFDPGIELCGRQFWPPPRPDQLAMSRPEFIRASGVTTKRAEALVAVGVAFAAAEWQTGLTGEAPAATIANSLLSISGIGPWTVQSALLWGVGDPDAHPTGDVALLRAARKHYPKVANLRELDRLAEGWKPARAWAARLLWLDLLGFDETSPNWARDGA